MRNLLTVLFSFLVVVLPALAAPVPEQLSPWLSWVKERSPEQYCPFMGTVRQCTWTGSLSVTLRKDGASFLQQGEADTDGWIVLPGGGGGPWPVLEQNSTYVVHSSGTRPAIFVRKGGYQVRGALNWEQEPSRLAIPEGIGVLEVVRDGKPLNLLNRSESGELLLGSVAETEEHERVQARIARRIVDGDPLIITTHVDVQIAGRAKSLRLPKALPPGGQVIAVRGDIPVSIQQQDLTLSSAPGNFSIEIDTAFSEVPTGLTTAGAQPSFLVPDEVWALQQDSATRVMEIRGPTQIDASLTNVPDEWKALPVYRVEPNQQVTLIVSQDTKGQLLAPTNLTLARRFWLDFNGAGFTVLDSINGSMSEGWRLNSDASLRLEQAKVNGQETLVTQDPATKLGGVELRAQTVSLETQSRLEPFSKRIKSSGWTTDFVSASLQLNLPPGWQLLWATGPDSVSGSWVSSWDLLDLFLFLLVVVATFRSLGIGAGVAAAIVYGIGHSLPGIPLFGWFLLLLALVMRRWSKGAWTYYIALAVYALLTIAALSYAISEVRAIFYPQLDDRAFRPGEIVSVIGFFSWFVGGPVGVAAIALMGMGALLALVRLRWRSFFKLGFFLVLGVIVCAIAQGSRMSSTRFSPVASKQYLESARENLAAPQSMDYAGSDSALLHLERKAKVPLRQDFDDATRSLIQTGRGIPEWGGETASLSWSRRVTPSGDTTLMLLTPLQWSGLRLLVLLCLATLLALAGSSLGLRFKLPLARAAAAGFLAFLLVTPSSRLEAQSFPDTALLKELENKLLNERCDQPCVSASRVNVRVVNGAVELEAQVYARESGAWALPGPMEDLVPLQVQIDGKQTSALQRASNRHVYVRIPQGAHSVVVALRPRREDSISLSFPDAPAHLTVLADGYTIEGLDSFGRVRGSLQLTRARVETDASSPEEESAQQPWFLVQRRIDLGAQWQVFTRVTRLGNATRPEIFQLPLLPGEVILSSDTAVVQGRAELSFGKGQAERVLESELQRSDEILLSALAGSGRSSYWELSCSAQWRCEIVGDIPFSEVQEGAQVYLLKPAVGTPISIKVSRPAGAEGATTSVESAVLQVTEGSEEIDAQLSLRIRSSRAGQEQLTLPDGAELKSLFLDGQLLPLPRDKGTIVTVPIQLGMHTVQASWQQAALGYGAITLPKVVFSLPISNLRLNYQPAPQRWLLWIERNVKGPVVLFWPKLLLVLVVALVLGRSGLTPLASWQWVLLGIGLATLPLGLAAVPALWFLLTLLRKHWDGQEAWAFNLLQLVWVAVSLGAIVVLLQAVHVGLLLKPDMQIAGNGSTAVMLSWYFDQLSGSTPAPFLISVSLWCWRGFMLIWSLWLSFALLRWMRWGWGIIAAGGFWRKSGA